MLEEFEKLTGFYPTAELYAQIEAAYIDFDGDKVKFCKAYKKNEGGIAERIRREVDMQHINAQCKVEGTHKAMEERIAELEKTLEREQEWQPYENTDNVQQSDYERLANQSDTERMSDEKAKDLLCEWYGFAKEKIKIHHSVPVYEVNRHRRLRQVGELDRSPLYNATDWNYIRFDCGCMSYEFYNDNLRPYIH